MNAFFFDSSGVVKRYLKEVGSEWVRHLVEPSAGNRIYVARITGVEVISAVVRRERGGSITRVDAAGIVSDFRRDLVALYRVTEMTSGLLDRAMTLAEVRGLRGYDAVQLSTALEIHERHRGLGSSLTFISADRELNAAAVAEGMAVDDPNAHP